MVAPSGSSGSPIESGLQYSVKLYEIMYYFEVRNSFFDYRDSVSEYSSEGKVIENIRIEFHVNWIRTNFSFNEYEMSSDIQGEFFITQLKHTSSIKTNIYL